MRDHRQNAEHAVKLGIVIPTWNGIADTLDCLSSLFNQTLKELVIVVVDNGSRDQTPEQVSRYFPQVHLICNPANLGFAEGSNLGIRKAKELGAEYVLLLNNDTLLPPDTLHKLVQYADAHPDAEVFGARLHNEPSATMPLARKNLHWHWSQRKTGQSKKYSGPVGNVWGCGMLVRSRLFDNIGYFDATFFAYDEDRDFCRRARAAGFDIHYVSGAVIRHRVSAATGGLIKDSSLRAYLLGRNRVRLWRKDLTPRGVPSFIIRFCARCIVNAGSRWLRRNPDAATAALIGMWEGLISRQAEWPRFPAQVCDVNGIDPDFISAYTDKNHHQTETRRRPWTLSYRL